MTAKVQLRVAGPADEPVLVDAFLSARPELGLLPAELAGLQLRAQRQQYALAYPGLREQVVEVNGQPAGRCVTWAGGSELRLLDISLLPPYRGRGAGRSVLSGLIAQAAADRVPLRLAVWPANHDAIRLYRSLGLRAYDEQHGYLLMQLPALAASPAGAGR